MKKPILLISLLATFAILTSCEGKKTNQSEQVMEEKKPEPKPTYSGKTIAGTTHTVEDYAKWEKVYLEVSIPESRVGVLRGIDDPNLIAVFEFTTSHEEAEANLNSDELKGHMERGGVNSDPVTIYYDMKYMTDIEITAPYRLAINHEVSDFNSWKSAFDNDRSRRQEAGISLIGLATDSGNPNMVYIMFGVMDISKAEAMFENPDMQKVMKDAGVISDPAFSFWQI